MLRILSAAILLMTLLVGDAVCQTEPFLDVTKLRVPSNEDAPHTFSGGLSGLLEGGQPPRPLPIKVTLLRLDKESYRWGEALVLDVRVENTGDKPVAFPWTIDSRLSNPGKSAPNSLLVALLRPLCQRDQTGQNEDLTNGVMPSVVLYGITDAPSTFITLQPGATARIRMPSKISVQTDKLPHFPFEMVVGARLSFNRGPLVDHYLPSVSANSVTINVEAMR